MSNQVILWSMFIVPWLTLFFMPKDDLKCFMPAGLFIMATGTFIQEVGLSLNMFVIRENVFPFYVQLPIAYGIMPIATMWLLKFMYGRFWLYALSELIFSIVFSYLVLPWLSTRGTQVLINATSLKLLIPAIPHFVSIYLYQMWQEGVFAHYTERKSFSHNLQPVAAKPFSNDPDDEDNK